MLGKRLNRRSIGQQAESQVHKAARRRGWQLLHRNYTARGGELDLVYRHGGELIIVEVRYRSRDDYGGALASVTSQKQRRIIAATRYLLAQQPAYANLAIRFDVVAVDRHNNLDWVESAFHAE